MIKPHNFREALGLTQEETAMLLKIPISQLAMFEIGRRDLPMEAKLKLVTMYNYVQKKQQEMFQHPSLKGEETKMAKIVAEELHVNQREQLIIERKINNLKSKFQKSVSTLQLADYLETQESEQEKYEKELPEILRHKALKGIEKNGMSTQIKWNLKLNALQLYEKELQKALKHYKTDAVS